MHRKAPTTTKMMVKAPTEMMMTMTRMWFSLVPPTPGLPEERRETGLDWKRFYYTSETLEPSYQLQLRYLEGAGFQKVLALVEDLRLSKNRKNTLKYTFTTFMTGHIYSDNR